MIEQKRPSNFNKSNQTNLFKPIVKIYDYFTYT